MRQSRLAPISKKKLRALGGKLPSSTVPAMSKRRRQERSTGEEYARLYGCEYADALRERYRLKGCPFCGHTARQGVMRRCHLHHTVQGEGREAQHLVEMCSNCHNGGALSVHVMGRLSFEAHYRVNLAEMARERDSWGIEEGFLPTGCCGECGKWHSVRFLVEEVDGERNLLRQLCPDCAPEGPA